MTIRYYPSLIFYHTCFHQPARILGPGVVPRWWWTGCVRPVARRGLRTLRRWWPGCLSMCVLLLGDLVGAVHADNVVHCPSEAERVEGGRVSPHRYLSGGVEHCIGRVIVASCIKHERREGVLFACGARHWQCRRQRSGSGR